MSSGQFLLNHKTIADLIDGRSGVKEILNFPLTISLEEPEPVRKGHIWIQTDKEVNNILIRKYLPLTAEVNDVCIVTYNANVLYNICHSKMDDNENCHIISSISGTEEPNISIFNISEVEEDNFNSIITTANPRNCFIKTENSWELIDAFWHNGNKWIQFGLKERYVFAGGNKNLYSFSFNGSDFNLLQDLQLKQYSSSNNLTIIAKTKKDYLLIQDYSGVGCTDNRYNFNSTTDRPIYVYKREGIIYERKTFVRPSIEEVFCELRNRFPETNTSLKNHTVMPYCFNNFDISQDGSLLYLTFIFSPTVSANTNSDSNRLYLIKFVNNGDDTFSFDKLYELGYYTLFLGNLTPKISPNNKYIAIYRPKLNSTYSNPAARISCYKILDNGDINCNAIFELNSLPSDIDNIVNKYRGGFGFSDDGKYFVVNCTVYEIVEENGNVEFKRIFSHNRLSNLCFLDFFIKDAKNYIACLDASTNVVFLNSKTQSTASGNFVEIFCIEDMINLPVVYKDYDKDIMGYISQFAISKDGNYLYTYHNYNIVRVFKTIFYDDYIDLELIYEYNSNTNDGITLYADYLPLMVIN